MPQIITVPNFISGVSQQAEALRLPSHAEVQTNGYSSLVAGQHKRPPTEHVAVIDDTFSGHIFAHTINRDADEQYEIIIESDGTEPGTTIRVFALDDGTEQTVNILCADKSYLATIAPHTLIKALTLIDTTFLLNSIRDTAITTTPEASPLASALFYLKRTVASTAHTVSVTVGAETWTGSKTSSGSTPNSTTIINDLLNHATTGIVRVVSTPGAAAWVPGDWTITNVGNTAVLERTDATDFDLAVTDGQSGTCLFAVKNRTDINDYDDLPNNALAGMVVKVSPDPEINADDYYVIFARENAAAGLGQGSWTETDTWIDDVAMDVTTMPHTLTRNSLGEFDFDEGAWEGRTVGDADTSDAPSFVGEAISAMTLYRNRLGILAGDKICLSEAGQFYNFWPVTVTNRLDSARIDTTAAHTTVATLHGAVPFARDLILFSDQTQFALTSDGTLTPENAALDQTTEFQTARTQPIAAGKNIYFIVANAQYSRVYEYFVRDEAQFHDAADITAHVPHYIEGEITHLTAASSSDIIIAQTGDASDTLYVYQYLWGPQAKLQSAWGKWTFNDGIIHGVDFINNTAYLIIDRDGALCIEKITVGEGLTDTGSNYITCLDRRVSEADCTVQLIAGQTKITPPYAITDGAVMQVYKTDGTSLTVDETTSAYVLVNGDHTADSLWIGEQYTHTYRPTAPRVRSQTPAGNYLPIYAGTLRVNSVELACSNTAYFKVTVTTNGTDYTIPITGRMLGGGTPQLDNVPILSGTHTISIAADAGNFTLDIINDSPLPAHFVGATWSVQYDTDANKILS